MSRLHAPCPAHHHTDLVGSVGVAGAGTSAGLVVVMVVVTGRVYVDAGPAHGPGGHLLGVVCMSDQEGVVLGQCAGSS